MEKTKNFNSWGGGGGGQLLNCFLLFFFNHENYIIKNICVYSKSKIKAKVTSKQNLEHFKMINRRLFIHKFCNNSKMLVSSSWAIFIRALVFSSPPRDNISFEYLFFVSTNFSIHSQKNNYIIIKIVKFRLCFAICFDTAKHSHVLF